MAKKGDKFQTYSEEFKIQVDQSYLNNEGSQSAIAKKYGLKSKKHLGIKDYFFSGRIYNEDVFNTRGRLE
ncbi:transposase [Peribacillus sp. SIMBA_075]|uniref:transposase n=1 Tax=Peribacillus sp. SIMBA_075 TaxID=3085813 RepID=UPI00397E8543